MSGDRSFSRGEIGSVLTFVLLAAVIGVTSYRTGLGISGGGGGADMVASAAAAPVNGQTIYASNCAGCHGSQAQGGVGPGLDETKGWSAADFREAVLRGHAPGGRTLSPVMPHFADTGIDGAPATDEQIDAIHAYVKGL